MRTFQAAFKANTAINLMKPPKMSTYDKNPKDTFNLITNYDWTSSVYSNGNGNSEDDINSTPNGSFISKFQDISLEGCSVIYFAGYLGKKCVHNFKCGSCQRSLLDDTHVSDDDNILIFYKN